MVDVTGVIGRPPRHPLQARSGVSDPPLLEVKGDAADNPLCSRPIGGAVSGEGGPARGHKGPYVQTQAAGDSRGNTMDQYAIPGLVSQRASCHASGMNEDLGEPTRGELLQAIQDSQQVLESKIETVAIEVKLLCTDLRKVSEFYRAITGGGGHL
ncbi:hypothetical protein NDU88_002803 [Pleurodeles waltl]|uniref:Uncharacterized protein n=1 Tax=Pleurodeles waltl TaxID=8319 RepID=A0AAV7LGM5_PLEWA|nr:hypothetical protein NDU88_002803 [Pleurodeles waltl]